MADRSAPLVGASESMAAEVGGRGKIIVQDHIPFFVATKLAKIRKASLFAPSPADWAKSSVSSIGCGGAVSVPYLPHKLQAFGLSCIPTPLWNMVRPRQFLTPPCVLHHDHDEDL